MEPNTSLAVLMPAAIKCYLVRKERLLDVFEGTTRKVRERGVAKGKDSRAHLERQTQKLSEIFDI